MTTSPPRKRDGDQRRRELCDAGIQVLAEHGSRGLTHAQVDRCAKVPDGTASYYFRTRAALLRGVGDRVAQIDVANLRSLADRPHDPRAPFAHLAELTLMQAHGRGLMLNRARHELLLNAARDPELSGPAQGLVSEVIALTRTAIARLQPDTTDPDLLDAQTSAVTTFIAGVFLRFVAGDQTFNDPGKLSRQLQAIAEAAAHEYGENN